VLLPYRRPEWEPQVFVDDSGAPIPYGQRWDGAGPPDTTYSAVTHPERFAPLHLVAQALLDHLVATSFVRTCDHRAHFDALGDVGRKVVSGLHLRPEAPDQAPLTIALVEGPAVVVQAGFLSRHWFPDCSCDACDVATDDVATQLEGLVWAVVAGTLRETVFRRHLRRVAWHQYSTTDGCHRAEGPVVGASTYPAGTVEALQRFTRLAPGGWLPWRRVDDRDDEVTLERLRALPPGVWRRLDRPSSRLGPLATVLSWPSALSRIARPRSNRSILVSVRRPGLLHLMDRLVHSRPCHPDDLVGPHDCPTGGLV
jgi:hypothetical protein